MPADSQERLLRLLAGFATRRILVVGDLMLDEFIWGSVSRISPEAPVPIVNVTGESYYPGGAANVARNLREFTPHVAIMGLAGADPAGDRLLALLAAAGIDTAAVQRTARYATIQKTRIIARNQQVVRVDRERKPALSGAETTRAIEQCDEALPAVDAIVVADYGKGFVTQALADHLCAAVRAQGKILAVDPHPHTSIDWSGVTAVKPNRLEAFLAAGMPASDPVSPVLADEALLEVGRRLRRRWQAENLLITLGEHGMLLFAGDAPPGHLPTRAKEVFDVSGAGDTAIAVLTVALAAGATPAEAAELANRASGIAVGKLGTATVTLAELQESLRAPKSAAVFFDRDGTLMEDPHYCGQPELVHVFPGIPEALRRLKDAGFRIFIVSNQSGIGRGFITEQEYHAVQAEVLRQIGPGLIDASYFCPDPPGTPSTRRKPEPGMLLEAAAAFDIDLARSFLIGDKAADVECGRRAGVATIQVATGYGEEQRTTADHQARDVVDAIGIVLRQRG